VDPLVECEGCEKRFRADKLVEEKGFNGEAMSLDELSTVLEETKNEPCPCGKMKSCSWGKPKQFNLLLNTNIGPVESDASRSYLRPETAQGAYMRQPLPFGIGQIGKSFRNEISPGNFIFRTREFDQMELQWFCSEESAEEWYSHWILACKEFLKDKLGLRNDSIRIRNHAADELAHYARATSDIEFNFPSIGWGELWGIANRGIHDLTMHSKASNEELVHDLGNSNSKVTPVVIEPAVGVNRLILAILCDAYEVENIVSANGKSNPRTVLRLKRDLAPFTVAVFPLSAKDDAQMTICNDIHNLVIEWGSSTIDTKGKIGKRYRRHDEIGTPYCVTADFESSADGCVTVRDRDTMNQVRIPLSVFVSKKTLFEAIDAGFSKL